MRSRSRSNCSVPCRFPTARVAAGAERPGRRGAAGHRWVSGSIAVGSFGLTVGYVLWLLRGGALLASLLSSLPAWRLIDPLPVLSRVDDEDDAEEDQDAFVSFEDANLPFPVTPEKA